MRLILTRHAQTFANKKGLFSGQAESRLTKEGVEQARRLGERLKGEIIHGAYSSEFGRAKQTARAALRHHPKVKLQVMKELAESNLGTLEKRPKHLYRHLTQAEMTRLYGVESDSAVMKRVKKALKELYKRHKGETILVVGHGWVNKIIELSLMGLPASKAREARTMPNCAISIFEIGDTGAKAVMLGSAAHLGQQATRVLAARRKR